MCYNTIRKGKEILKMKKKLVNLWKSELTGMTYEAPVDWMPAFGGWTLVATVEVDA